MKIGIMTFCRADNYGSVLQSYALQNFINNEFGCEVELIDFMTCKQVEIYRTSKYESRSLKNIIKFFLNILVYNRYSLNKRKAFDKYREKRLQMSNIHYDEYNYKTVAEHYDAVICGSDQIWNMDAYDFHQAYLLKGISCEKIHKISYAPSLGGYDSIRQNKNREIEFKLALENFKAISVREYSGANILEKLINRNISVLVDPVFLLTRDKWSEVADSVRKVNNDNYILFYSIDYNESALKIAKKISKIVNLPVIVLYTSNKTLRSLKFGFEISEDKSPEQFLSLIKNSRLVLTTSFHGTAFSIIFRKNFWVIRGIYDGKNNNDDRMTTILSKTHLENRNIIAETLDGIDLLKKIDYNEVIDLIDIERDKSKAFLEKSLFS